MIKLHAFGLMLKIVLLTVILLNTTNALEPFELDEFLKGSFQNRGWNGTWVSDTVFLAKDRNQTLYRVNVPFLETEVLLTADVLKDYPGNSVAVTPDLKYILIRYNQKAVFRHSTTAQFTIYDIENKKFYHIADKKHLQLAKWAPVGAGLIYVLENNIYYIPTPENVSNPTKITEDGIPGVIYNGVPDWVYEEEVLGSGSAVWFSPDGKRLVFASFDDRGVDEFHYFIYGQPGNIENQYPEIVTLKYPKVGADNPLVAVKYVKLDNPGKEAAVLKDIIPQQIVTEDHVLKDVTWATNEEVVAVSLNRVQNMAAITRCNVETQTCEQELIIEEGRGWLDINAPIYSKDGTKYLLLKSEFEGSDSYKHIVLTDTTTTPQRKRLTFGTRVVGNIYGWDEPRGLIYYVGTVEDNPAQQQVYVYNLNTNQDVCLTCGFETPEGLCELANAAFSKGFSYYTKICSGPGPTIVQVQNLLSLNYFVWENNSILRQELAAKLQPVRKDFIVALVSGFNVRVRLLLPPGLDENASVKYPLIVNVYAGPNSNRISDAFSTGVENYFVTNRNYIYAYIDGRGSGKNGDRFMFEVYRKLGTVEIEDQIEVTKFLQKNCPYIDASRTGIWGWSYGGFSTIWTLIKDKENVFKLGLAIAPVTSFIYYDSIYTERYMGLPTPEDNLGGYNNTDTTRQVEALRNKTLFLIHGNADDNVHYQQSMLLAKALERADILFYQQSYPDENHSLGSVSPHLYHTIDRYFDYGFRSTNPKKWKLAKVNKKIVKT